MATRMSDRINVIAVTWNMTDHCNLTCANCNHASPLLDRKFLDLDQFEKDLGALQGVLHAEEIKLLGGEPMLHPKVSDAIKLAKESNIADKVRIISNGVLLHRADDEFWKNVDILEVSVYPGVKYKGGGEDGLQAYKDKAQEFGVHFYLPPRWDFKKTLLNNRIEDPVLVDYIYRNCGQISKWGCHTVQDGRYYKCGPAPYLEERMAKRGEPVKNKEIDSVALHGNPRLREELEAYLKSEKPLKACEYCLGENGVMVEHKMLRKQEIIDENLANDGDIQKKVYFPPAQRVQMMVRRKLLRVLS